MSGKLVNEIIKQNKGEKNMTQKIALVTGASSGIGRATAKLLAKNDYYVFAAARRMAKLEQIRSDHIEPVRLDVMDEEAAQATVNHIMATKGRIDVLVNNVFRWRPLIVSSRLTSLATRDSCRQFCHICGSRNRDA